MKKKLLPVFFSLLFFCSVKIFAQQPATHTTVMEPAATMTSAEIAAKALNFVSRRPLLREEREHSRKRLPQDPLAPKVSSFPPEVAQDNANRTILPYLPQVISTSFNGVTGPDETGAFPPDDMGAVGPTQYIVFVNGRLRSFNKTTGAADGVLNADPDVFFASVMTPLGGGVVNNFTSDPRIRYDRFSGKWILMIIDVPCTNASCTSTAANRIMFAYSNTSTITAATVWTFYQFKGDPGTNFADYPTLGVDVNALYIGTNMFTSAGSFVGTNGYVINRNTLLSGGAVTVYTFANLASGAAAGPFTPQGVDNFDPAPTEGYFIGVDNSVFSRLVLRRVSTPAGVPTISGNLNLTVPTTTSATSVTHLGNTGGTNGNLDALDDRLFAAVQRNGHLWTAHNFRVSAAGVANTAAAARHGVRWYDITNLGTTPSLVQSGTIFDNAATLAAARQYFIPTVMVSGQGHVAFSLSTAGTNFRSDAATTGRLNGDALGTTQIPQLTTASSTAYNPPADPGGPRRWGDYSYVSLDPLDDMTMWMINQYCVTTNKYGCNVTKLLAPPPATPAFATPVTVNTGIASTNITLTGTSVSGSGFYDPGADLPPPALPFNHIAASITGGVTVNSVTYTSPLLLNLNISTVGASVGPQSITVTNPDGQSMTGVGVITITAAAPTTADLSITKTDGVTTVVPGGTTTYTITASNAGPDPVTGATVSDIFPATVTSVNWTAAYAGGGTGPASGSGNINASVDLPAGASATFTAVCTLSPTAAGTLSNTATVTLPAGMTDPVPGNNSATDSDTFTPMADLSITKTDGVTTYIAGGTTTYTITATNPGPSSVIGATVSDAFPPSITSVNWTAIYTGGATGATSGSGNINTLVDMPVGSSVTFTAVCTISAAASGTLANTAVVTAPAGVTDPVPGNNSATDTDAQAVPILSAAGATITAENCTPPNGAIDPGEMVTVSFCIQNTGTLSTTNLIATLQNTGGVTGVSAPQNYGVVVNGGPAVCRNFTFTASGSCGSTLTATLALQDGLTSYGTITYTFTLGVPNVVVTQSFDGVSAPALPAGWTTSFVNGAANCTPTGTCALGTNWTTVTTNTPPSSPNAAFHNDPTCVTDNYLVTPAISIVSNAPQISFTHAHNLESTFDGTVLEVSSPNINGGAFTDITNGAVGGGFVTGGYNGTISLNFLSPIAGRQAWTGLSGGSTAAPGYINTVANLGPNLAGQTITLRWRFASDCSVAATGLNGHWIDNVNIIDGTTCCVCIPPTVNPVPNQVVCNNASTTAVIFSGSSPTAAYNWTNNNTAIGLAASGSGNIASFTATNATSAPITGTVTVTPVEGCPGSPTTFTYTVNPTPNAVATPSSQTICSGANITTIILSSAVSGTTYNWTRNNTATVTGIAASGSGNISGALTNTTTAPVTVTFTITPTANGCPGAPITATVLVNPTPNAVATPASQSSCSGSPITTIVLSGNVTGTTFNWTRNNTATVTGIAASGSGNISGTLTNTTNAPITVTFTITPNANGCNGPTTTATVTVNPIPAIVTPTIQVIITGNGSFADEISWTLTNSLSAVILSGGPYGFNPPATPSAAVPATNAPYTFFIEAQGTFNDNSCLWEVRCNGNIVASGCIKGTNNTNTCPSIGTLTVPNIQGCNPLTPQTICSGTAIAPMTFSSSVTGTTFNWTRDNNVNVTGIPASGTGTISGVLTNTTTVPQTVIFTVTPTANGCPGTPVTVSVLVNPAPTGTATPASQTICSGTAITSIALTSNMGGTTYTWTRNNTANVTGIAASGTGTPISGTLTNTTTTAQTTTFTVIPTSGGCAGPAVTATVTVQAPLTVTCPANVTVNAAAGTCAAIVNYPPATTTGTPAPTVTYSIPSGSSFPVGTTTVTVTATNTCGVRTCTFNVTVLDVQIPNITTAPVNRTVCVGSNATFSVVSTFASSYQWQSFNGTAWVNITGATASSYTLNNVAHALNASSYRVLVTGPCGTVTTSTHATLYVNPLPGITITTNIQPVLLPGQFVTLTAVGNPPGGTFVWFKNNVVIPGATGPTLGPLSVDDAGVYKVTYTDLNGCVNTSVNLTVSPLLTGNLYIYPNPNSGQFHVRFYNETNEDATVTVYNYLGAIVYQKKFTTGPLQYSVIDIDLGKRLAIGTYVVEVRNSKAQRIGAKLISVGRE